MDGPTRLHGHRLHFHWSQLEADQICLNSGSAVHPPCRVSRTLELDPKCELEKCPSWLPSFSERKQFAACADVYKTIGYHTFCKNGTFKLYEVELFFLSSNMTITSSCEWAVVYLGVGNGERFRHLRDEFFPDLSVIAFDPFEDGPHYKAQTEIAVENAKRWNSDGSRFVFHVRCFDLHQDISLVQEFAKGKKLLLISDIRGCALTNDGKYLDKASDMRFQWEAIQRLHPVSSLVKFDAPDYNQFFEYAPGVLLKQVFQNFGSSEVRLLIEGVPSQTRRYNAWDLYTQMKHHHEYLRGKVHDSTRCTSRSTRCFDFCFDCEVFWQTVSTYATQNSLCPYTIFGKFMSDYAEILSSVEPCDSSQRWWDVQAFLAEGRITEAIAVLEAVDDNNDWADIGNGLSECQPSLSTCLAELPRPASRDILIQRLGSLSKPFVLVKTYQNGLSTY